MDVDAEVGPDLKSFLEEFHYEYPSFIISTKHKQTQQIYLDGKTAKNIGNAMKTMLQPFGAEFIKIIIASNKDQSSNEAAAILHAFELKTPSNTTSILRTKDDEDFINAYCAAHIVNGAGEQYHESTSAVFAKQKNKKYIKKPLYLIDDLQKYLVSKSNENDNIFYAKTQEYKDCIIKNKKKIKNIKIQ